MTEIRSTHMAVIARAPDYPVEARSSHVAIVAKAPDYPVEARSSHIAVVVKAPSYPSEVHAIQVNVLRDYEFVVPANTQAFQTNVLRQIDLDFPANTLSFQVNIIRSFTKTDVLEVVDTTETLTRATLTAQFTVLTPLVDLTVTTSRIEVEPLGIFYSLWGSEAAAFDAEQSEDFYPVLTEVDYTLFYEYLDRTNSLQAIDVPVVFAPEFEAAIFGITAHLVAPWFTIDTPGVSADYVAPRCGW